MVRHEDYLQRSVLWWIQDEDSGKSHAHYALDEEIEDLTKFHKTIQTEAAVQQHGVPQDIFLGFLKKEIESNESCLSLPFTLLLVISYALVAISHDDATKVNAVEDSISFDIQENANFAFTGPYMGHKNIDDVNSYADFWSWINQGLLPLIWVQSYNLAEGRNWSEPYVQLASETFDRQSRGVLLHYNRIILGVRLSQERNLGECAYDLSGQCVPPDRTCRYSPLKDFYDKECVGGHGYELEPEKLEARVTTNPTRIHWLYIHDDAEYIRQQLIQMEKGGWLDEKTRKIEIAIPVYNAEYGLHTMFMCAFFFSRGGHIWKEIIPLSAFAQGWNSFMSIIFDLIWGLCLLYVIGAEGVEIFGVLRDFGVCGIWYNYIGFWNAVDWLSVFSGMGIIALFLTNLSNISLMNERLNKLGSLNEVHQRSEYRAQGKLYVEALEAEVQFAYIFRLFQAGYPLVIFLRLFKAFGSQPRLAVVTKTLTHAWIDLVHFLIIFMSVFFTYTVAGVVLFGREVESFTTTFRSMITCFRAMFGDFDFEEMQSVGRFDAIMWFLPFMILIVLVLLNMLIAIVMDAHADVVSGLEHEDSITALTQKAFATKSRKWRKTNVPLSHILRALEEKTEREKIQSKLDDNGDTLGDDISDEEDSEDDEGRRRTSIKSYGSNSLFGSPSQVTDIQRVTVKDLRDLFPGRMKTPQAKSLIREAILYYYAANRKVGDMNEISQTIGAVDYRIRKLEAAFKEMQERDGLAVNHPEDIARLAKECFEETEESRLELGEWLPEDEDDVCLPQYWLRPRDEGRIAIASRPGPEAGSDLSSLAMESRRTTQTQDGRDLLKVVKNFRHHEGGAGRHVAQLVQGGFVQLLSDEHLVLKACRDAGLSTANDHLRKQALGKLGRITEYDDDGTVKCHIPRVGDIWFSKTAFVPLFRRQEESGKASYSNDASAELEALEAKKVELEEEVAHGKEVVEECLQGLKTLHDELMQMKQKKREGIEKFNQYRQKAVQLQRGNVAENERFKDLQKEVESCATERDELFEKVKQLAKENRDLEELIAAKEAAFG